ncbi:MAG: alkaline phosphatase family protein [Sphingobacteriales bacterium]|nr:MAG: alkaline phosphatase family protein [Sphingobacteriales bacterium]
MEFDCNPTFATIQNDSNISSISFGSCSDENSAQPILSDVVNLKPDLFIYLGDNIYADANKCSDFFKSYSKLACKQEFKNLVAQIPTIATWDDHDYGKNDGGIEYNLKTQSKHIFLKFWNEPKDSDRYKHEGIYNSKYFGDDNHKVQVILLDTRTFRSSLKGGRNSYTPDYSINKTMLGDEQWKWLEAELLKPAKVRIIASSTQFGIEHNGWEAWANFPKEQQKMADLIASTKANGVIFISGDVHYAELSKQTFNNTYPFYDCTSSGITNIEYNPRKNKYRLDNAVSKINYGNLNINWESNPISIEYKIYTINNEVLFQHLITLDEISFKP